MGREPSRSWKYVYFCIAGLICLLPLGCAISEHPSLRNEAQEYLLRGRTLLSQKNYDGALSEFQKVLSLPPDKPSKDDALFNIGLVYAHFGYPQRDVEKSLEFFKRLINHYPKSALAEEAKMWIAVLEENEKLNEVIQKMKQVDIEIEEMRRRKTQ